MKTYIQPLTKTATCLPQTNVLLLGSPTGPEPKAPLRQFDGESYSSLKYLI